MTQLPPAIAAYFAADPAADAETLAGFFARDARLRDEGRDYGGIAAIRAWRVDTYARTPFVARPLAADDRGSLVVVSVAVSGAFAGSPITLDHAFILADGRISSLEIG